MATRRRCTAHDTPSGQRQKCAGSALARVGLVLQSVMSDADAGQAAAESAPELLRSLSLHLSDYSSSACRTDGGSHYRT